VEAAVVCTRSVARIAFSVLLLSMTVAIGCVRRPTPEEAGRLLSKRKTDRFQVATFECREGEKQWDYICQAKYEPTPAADRFTRPLTQRVGIFLMPQTYKGEPLFGLSGIPGDGPIPSRDEYSTWLRQRNQDAERKAAANRRNTGVVE